MKAWRRGALGAVMMAPMTVLPAAAWTEDQVDWCADGGFPPHMQIRGCTAAIQSGTWSGKGLAFIYVNRGNAYYLEHDYDQAIADYDQAIRLDPQNADYFASRCRGRVLVGRDLPAALMDCSESLRLRPADTATLVSRGLVQLRLGAFDKALEDYGAAVAQNGRDAEALYGRGIARIKSGDAAGGEADIAAARAIEPDVADAHAWPGP